MLTKASFKESFQKRAFFSKLTFESLKYWKVLELSTQNKFFAFPELQNSLDQISIP